MADYLIGSTAPNTTYSGNADYTYSGIFTASADGTATEIRFYCNASCNVKVAIYTSSTPHNRLGVNNAGTSATGGQWNTISISDTVLELGTSYLVSIVSDTGSYLGLESASGGSYRRETGTSYSTGCPDPLPSGTSGSWIISINAYGTLATSSYESELGTGALTMLGGTPSAGVSRDPATLGSGSMVMSGGNIDATPTFAADSTLGTGAMVMSGGNLSTTNGWYATLGTGNIEMSATGIRSIEHYESEIGTGVMSMSGAALDQLF